MMMLHSLDIFQVKKRKRMMILLAEIEQMKRIPLKEFFSHVAVQYGIRRDTAVEYVEDWIDGGYISVENNVIHFIKKPEYVV